MLIGGVFLLSKDFVMFAHIIDNLFDERREYIKGSNSETALNTVKSEIELRKQSAARITMNREWRISYDNESMGEDTIEANRYMKRVRSCPGGGDDSSHRTSTLGYNAENHLNTGLNLTATAAALASLHH